MTQSAVYICITTFAHHPNRKYPCIMSRHEAVLAACPEVLEGALSDQVTHSATIRRAENTAHYTHCSTSTAAAACGML